MLAVPLVNPSNLNTQVSSFIHCCQVNFLEANERESARSHCLSLSLARGGQSNLVQKCRTLPHPRERERERRKRAPQRTGRKHMSAQLIMAAAVSRPCAVHSLSRRRTCNISLCALTARLRESPTIQAGPAGTVVRFARRLPSIANVLQ